LFDVSGNAGFAAAMAEQDLDNESICVVRREINTTGKSRAFINDTPVTLQVLNKLTGSLVDLHQQFGHLALQEDSFQFDVVDAMAKHHELRTVYTGVYKNYKSKFTELQQLRAQQQQWQKEADYKQFLLNEFNEAQLKEDEIEDAEQQLKQLSHAEKILAALNASKAILDEGEQHVTGELKRVIHQLQGVVDVMPDIQNSLLRINSVWVELKDIADELDSLQGKVNVDAQLMEQLQNRLDVGYKLYKKHGLKTTAELIALQQSLQDELQVTQNLNDKITVIEKELQLLHDEVSKTAKELSSNRSNAIPGFVKRTNELLVLVGMPNAKVKIDLSRIEEPNVMGLDSIQFLLDANKSGQFLPIHKAASGGEMSRIMLCIKSLTAEAMQMPTMIFDEVDTGISGEAARQVGLLLRQLARYHQVICITHQPQVAAKGTTHLYVYKEESDAGTIKTQVRLLNHEERVHAIAQMIGGEKPSNTAIANAKELVNG
jgi:DNA repair protein RecN (Recombination protein N)